MYHGYATALPYSIFELYPPNFRSRYWFTDCIVERYATFEKADRNMLIRKTASLIVSDSTTPVMFLWLSGYIAVWFAETLPADTAYGGGKLAKSEEFGSRTDNPLQAPMKRIIRGFHSAE